MAAFICQQVAWAAPATGQAAAPATVARPTFGAEHPSAIAIPFEFATLKEFHQGTNGRVIIHIQDAHSNLSGQQSSAGALESLIKSHGIRLVFVEGGDRDVTLDDIRKLAPAEEWKVVAKRLLYEGIISGHEYLSLVSDEAFRLIGVEYSGLYMQNLEAYAGLVDHRKKALLYIHRIRASVERLKNRLYPKDLLKYEKLKSASGFTDSSAVHKRLFELCRKAGVGLERDFPQMFGYEGIQKSESSVDFAKAGEEQEALFKAISIKGGEAATLGLVNASKRARHSQTAQLSLFERTFELAASAKIDTSASLELNRYLEYLRRFAALDFAKLLDEIDAAENAVYKSLLEQGSAAKLRAVDRYLDLLDKGYSIRMSSKEFDLLNRSKRFFADPAWQAFLNDELAKLGYIEDLVPYQPYLENGQQALDDFYDIVSRRDVVFMQNIERVMTAKNEKSAFLVAGGYHTQHLTELMRQAGYSYVVLSPVVTSETNHVRYEKLLLAPLKGARRSQNVESEVHSEKSTPGTAATISVHTLVEAALHSNLGTDRLGKMARDGALAELIGSRLNLTATQIIETIATSNGTRTPNPAPADQAGVRDSKILSGSRATEAFLRFIERVRSAWKKDAKSGGPQISNESKGAQSLADMVMGIPDSQQRIADSASTFLATSPNGINLTVDEAIDAAIDSWSAGILGGVAPEFSKALAASMKQNNRLRELIRQKMETAPEEPPFGARAVVERTIQYAAQAMNAIQSAQKLIVVDAEGGARRERTPNLSARIDENTSNGTFRPEDMQDMLLAIANELGAVQSTLAGADDVSIQNYSSVKNIHHGIKKLSQILGRYQTSDEALYREIGITRSQYNRMLVYLILAAIATDQIIQGASSVALQSIITDLEDDSHDSFDEIVARLQWITELARETKNLLGDGHAPDDFSSPDWWEGRLDNIQSRELYVWYASNGGNTAILETLQKVSYGSAADSKRLRAFLETDAEVTSQARNPRIENSRLALIAIDTLQTQVMDLERDIRTLNEHFISLDAFLEQPPAMNAPITIRFKDGRPDEDYLFFRVPPGQSFLTARRYIEGRVSDSQLVIIEFSQIQDIAIIGGARVSGPELYKLSTRVTRAIRTAWELVEGTTEGASRAVLSPDEANRVAESMLAKNVRLEDMISVLRATESQLEELYVRHNWNNQVTAGEKFSSPDDLSFQKSVLTDTSQRTLTLIGALDEYVIDRDVLDDEEIRREIGMNWTQFDQMYAHLLIAEMSINLIFRDGSFSLEDLGHRLMYMFMLASDVAELLGEKRGGMDSDFSQGAVRGFDDAINFFHKQNLVSAYLNLGFAHKYLKNEKQSLRVLFEGDVNPSPQVKQLQSAQLAIDTLLDEIEEVQRGMEYLHDQQLAEEVAADHESFMPLDTFLALVPAPGTHIKIRFTGDRPAQQYELDGIDFEQELLGVFGYFEGTDTLDKFEAEIIPFDQIKEIAIIPAGARASLKELVESAGRAARAAAAAEELIVAGEEETKGALRTIRDQMEKAGRHLAIALQAKKTDIRYDAELNLQELKELRKGVRGLIDSLEKYDSADNKTLLRDVGIDRDRYPRMLMSLLTIEMSVAMLVRGAAAQAMDSGSGIVKVDSPEALAKKIVERINDLGLGLPQMKERLSRVSDFLNKSENLKDTIPGLGKKWYAESSKGVGLAKTALEEERYGDVLQFILAAEQDLKKTSMIIRDHLASGAEAGPYVQGLEAALLAMDTLSVELNDLEVEITRVMQVKERDDQAGEYKQAQNVLKAIEEHDPYFVPLGQFLEMNLVSGTPILIKFTDDREEQKYDLVRIVEKEELLVVRGYFENGAIKPKTETIPFAEIDMIADISGARVAGELVGILRGRVDLSVALDEERGTLTLFGEEIDGWRKDREYVAKLEELLERSRGHSLTQGRRELSDRWVIQLGSGAGEDTPSFIEKLKSDIVAPQQAAREARYKGFKQQHLSIRGRGLPGYSVSLAPEKNSDNVMLSVRVEKKAMVRGVLSAAETDRFMNEFDAKYEALKQAEIGITPQYTETPAHQKAKADLVALINKWYYRISPPYTQFNEEYDNLGGLGLLDGSVRLRAITDQASEIRIALRGRKLSVGEVTAADAEAFMINVVTKAKAVTEAMAGRRLGEYSKDQNYVKKVEDLRESLSNYADQLTSGSRALKRAEREDFGGITPLETVFTTSTSASPFGEFVVTAGAEEVALLQSNPAALAPMARSEGQSYSRYVPATTTAVFVGVTSAEFSISGSDGVARILDVKPDELLRTSRATPSRDISQMPMLSTPTLPLDGLSEIATKEMNRILADAVDVYTDALDAGLVDPNQPVHQIFHLTDLMPGVPPSERAKVASLLRAAFDQWKEARPNNTLAFEGESYGLTSDIALPDAKVIVVRSLPSKRELDALEKDGFGASFHDTSDGNVSLLIPAFVINSMIGGIDLKKVSARHDGIKEKIGRILKSLTKNSGLKLTWDDIGLFQKVKASAIVRYNQLAIRAEAVVEMYLKVYNITVSATKWAA